MTSNSTSGLNHEGLNEDDIVRYLRAHPDFFERHTGLLEMIKLPHPASGGVVSLVERQVEVLRAKNNRLERKLMDLVEVARDNEGLSSRLHRLALGLMEAETLDDVVSISKEILRNEFTHTHVAIRLLDIVQGDDDASLHFMRSDQPEAAMFDQLFESKRPACTRPGDPQLAYLFPDVVPEVASSVMVPLVSDTQDLGVLAMGSADNDRFRSGMGTLFLGYLGELISCAVRAHLS